MAPDELSTIERYFRPLAGEGAFGLRDDAARLRVPDGHELVVTADMLAIGVHFLPDDPPGTIAQKALRVNLSDLAAKGATPLAYTLSIGLGPRQGDSWLADFAEGLRLDQERFGLQLLGGDTISAPGAPVISIAAFGLVPAGRMVHRFGGHAGDALYVSGTIGSGLIGLALLKGRPGPWDTLDTAGRNALIGRYQQPEPRVLLAAVLLDFASAAMDVSDGLIGDCDKLAGASGCSAVIRAESVLLPAGLEHVRGEALAELLTGGDDYEILAAVPPEREEEFRAAAAAAGVPVSWIGELTRGSARTEVLFDGEPLPLYKRAYMHGGGGAA